MDRAWRSVTPNTTSVKHMRILHAAVEVSGVASELARHQRSLGHDAVALSYRPHRFQYVSDITFPHWPAATAARKLWTTLSTTSRAVPRYDVFHLHAFQTLLPYMVDVPILRALGRTVIVHFHGCDVKQTIASTHPQAVHCPRCTLRDSCALHPQRWRRTIAERFADVIACSTPDLLDVTPGARYVPNPIDVGRWSPEGDADDAWRRRANPPMVVLHVPSDPLLKGTEHVVSAVDDLQRRSVPVRLHLAQGVAHQDMPSLYRSADVVVDQLYFGWYGLAAVEAMMTGRPVVAYLRPDLRERYDPPVVQADPGNLASVLESLYRQTPDERHELGVRGRRYAIDRHAGETVAQEWIELYQEAGAHA
jgi:glycosyltransferase involved in cell wall biosynthesis